jgi:hypothetical protein
MRQQLMFLYCSPEGPLDDLQADYGPTIQRSLSLEDDTMNENIVTLADVEDDILNYEVADEALEASAGIIEGQAKNVTISFCSGLDTCPS